MSIETYKNKKKLEKFKMLSYEMMMSLILTGVVLGFLSLVLFSFPKAEGNGMGFIIQNNERVLVYRYGKIERFSLVYFRVPQKINQFSIRRVIGLPGDKIEYKNNQLFVNNLEQSEYFLARKKHYTMDEGQFFTDNFSVKQLLVDKDKIPENYYLVLGDNRLFSSDSRYYGLVEKKEMIGVVKVRISSLSRLNFF